MEFTIPECETLEEYAECMVAIGNSLGVPELVTDPEEIGRDVFLDSDDPPHCLEMDDANIYAYLKTPLAEADDSWNSRVKVRQWLIASRHFIASCSSCWSWGIVRHPAYPVPTHRSVYSGPCDPLKELGSSVIKEGIAKAIKRANTGELEPACTAWTLTVERPGTYQDGWGINQGSLRKIKTAPWIGWFNLGINHEIIESSATHAYLLIDEDRELHNIVEAAKQAANEHGLCIGISKGELWYPSEVPVSEGWNRLWHILKMTRVGQVRIDIERCDNIGSITQYLAHPRSITDGPISYAII